ncbi:MAG TPA: ABC transporter permease [Candidatus Limnocylindria bacterium]|jgi:peptide/nickel transport system permease protein|nr:ABC transporter permease [Candidatus Limnocylindria bacterium]
MTIAIYARPTLGQRVAGPFVASVEFLRLLSKRPVGFAGFIGCVFFLFLAFVAPLFVPLKNDPSLAEIYQTPSLAHPLGTDFQGKDVLNQIVYGGRDILTIAILAAFFSTTIAITFGSIAATVGGRVDAAIVAITDVILTVPQLVLLIAVAAILRPTSFLFLAVILALLQWSSLLRQIRSQVLSLKERDYVEAARSLDLGLPHIIFREMLPSMRSYIAIHFILAMTQAMYAQVGIIILGLVPISGTNWGIMLYFAQGQGALFFRDSLWYILSPILAIVLVQLSLVSFASGLEEIFNPRLRGA